MEVVGGKLNGKQLEGGGGWLGGVSDKIAALGSWKRVTGRIFKISKKLTEHTATKIPLMYSFSGNSAASAPISAFMCLWAIYIVPGSVYIIPPAGKAYRSWEYINRSQTHDCGNWDWDPDNPFLGIFVSKFRYFVFAVQAKTWIWFFSSTKKQTIVIAIIVCTESTY